MSPFGRSSPRRAGSSSVRELSQPDLDEKFEERAVPATALLSLVGRESPETGHEWSGRPGGKMSGAEVRGTISRSLDEEQA
ncbi:hypothetical protein [Microbispora sp. CA-102843]|uniref:hypothetical protein n=1 Tax=Microbispora sp. CA-102843 TaxID=3239952 RepID=UPI003D8C38DB